ncbi:MAG: glycosyltransferase family 2 protein, partial [Longimicrobiales bacterium]
MLLPVRDGAEHIERALASLSSQTLGGFGVLVLDDGSEDGTAGICEAFSRADSRFRLVRGPREGLVPTLQRGLALVETPLVARMDADDVSHSERLERQLSFLQANEALAGCGSGVRYTPEAAVTDRSRAYQSWLNGMTSWGAVERDLFVECPLAHPTFFFRTEVLRAVGGYRDQGWPEDYDLLLRLWRAGHRFAAVPEVLLDWSIEERGLSRTHPAYSLEAFHRCRAHHLARSHLAQGREAYI